MAMGPERSKPLHNFSMPCLKWGNQRVLRCIKVTTEPSSSPSKRKPNHIDIDIDHNLNNIDAVRQKLMIDFRVAANNLKVSIFEESVANPRPWNLRTTRAACKAPRNLDEPVEKKEKKNQRGKFSVPLRREEVEHDFWALVGNRPPRRPKKRPRIVQRQLDTLFPGLWLTEVTADSYKVPDVP